MKKYDAVRYEIPEQIDVNVQGQINLIVVSEKLREKKSEYKL